MGKTKNNSGGVNTVIKGNKDSQIINNTNGNITIIESSFGGVKIVNPSVFKKKKTTDTPSKIRNKARIQIFFEILSIIVSMASFKIHWALGLFLILVSLAFLALSYRAFDLMKVLEKQKMSDLPPMMAFNLPNHKLMLDDENNVILCEISFECPKCGSKMEFKAKESLYGFSLICSRNNNHSFGDYDFTSLDKL